MLTIQELGLSILGDSPSHFYVLGGSEYGIKERYIQSLEKFYKCHRIESPSVDSVLSAMKTKRLIPLDPAVYVVRYDDKFVADINDLYAQTIRNCNISGTVVCIYENEKHVNKIDKYLPESTCSIDSVNPAFIEKYLKQDFPDLDDRLIKIAVASSTSYGHAKTLCMSMDAGGNDLFNRLTPGQISTMLGCSDPSTERELQIGIASRNFTRLIKSLDKFNEDIDRAIYSVLQTMIELDKIKASRYSDSFLKDYAKLWSPQDIYYMFMNGYDVLMKLRSSSSLTAEDSLIYLFGLLKFNPIPSPEVMSE